jgi:hypothetical protein
MSKVCYKCKNEQPNEQFGRLKSSKDGFRYDCKTCRKEYREENRDTINAKLKEYYASNKEVLLPRHKEYREQNKTAILAQRKEYRNREDIKERIQKKQKDYLPIRKEKIKERRKTDLNFQIQEVVKNKIHKFLKNRKTSYAELIGCDLEFFKKWMEYRFDETMCWENFGNVWQIDHILPLSLFDMTNELDKKVCFHWTNLQPLNSVENRSKSNKLQLHYYFNNLVSIFRFNKSKREYLGYQTVNESLQWLRIKLRKGENAPYNAAQKAVQIDNQQPSL